MAPKIDHQQVTAELMANGTVRLEQKDCGESYIVDLDGWQLRQICEIFGLVAPDHQAERTIRTLTRRLLVLNDRIQSLAHFLVNHGDQNPADLSFEMAFANATADIAAEFVAELEDCQQAPTETAKQAAGADTRQTVIDGL